MTRARGKRRSPPPPPRPPRPVRPPPPPAADPRDGLALTVLTEIPDEECDG